MGDKNVILSWLEIKRDTKSIPHGSFNDGDHVLNLQMA